jgi:hypothetical protein
MRLEVAVTIVLTLGEITLKTLAFGVLFTKNAGRQQLSFGKLTFFETRLD